eukprot:jgi/Galph1/309/GphlegSOOS_G5123.1
MSALRKRSNRRDSANIQDKFPSDVDQTDCSKTSATERPQILFDDPFPSTIIISRAEKGQVLETGNPVDSSSGTKKNTTGCVLKNKSGLRSSAAYLFVFLLVANLFYIRQSLRYRVFVEHSLQQVPSYRFSSNQSDFGVAGSRLDISGLRWKAPVKIFVRETNMLRYRKMVFVASSGRTGTGFLHNLFSLADNVVSLHEPSPRLVGRDLENALLISGNSERSRKERKTKKLSKIFETLSTTSPTTSYVETSHMFIKTMADFLVDELVACDCLYIIVLRRGLVSTINSQYSLGWFQPSHNGYRKWYYDIHDIAPEHAVLIPDRTTTNYDIIDKLIAYNLDIELRIQKLIFRLKALPSKYYNVEVLPVRVESFNSTDCVLEFLGKFGFTINHQKVGSLLSVPRNEREHLKSKRNLNTLPEEWLSRRIKEFVESYQRKGIISMSSARQFLSNL